MDGFWVSEFGLRIVALIRKIYVRSADIREMPNGRQDDSVSITGQMVFAEIAGAMSRLALRASIS